MEYLKNPQTNEGLQALQKHPRRRMVYLKNPQPGEGCGLYMKHPRRWMKYLMVPEVGIEPTRAQGPLDFESSASTSFTTPAELVLLIQHNPFPCQEN
jgi:hypothetical protein